MRKLRKIKDNVTILRQIVLGWRSCTVSQLLSDCVMLPWTSKLYLTHTLELHSSPLLEAVLDSTLAWKQNWIWDFSNLSHGYKQLDHATFILLVIYVLMVWRSVYHFTRVTSLSRQSVHNLWICFLKQQQQQKRAYCCHCGKPAGKPWVRAPSTGETSDSGTSDMWWQAHIDNQSSKQTPLSIVYISCCLWSIPALTNESKRTVRSICLREHLVLWDHR